MFGRGTALRLDCALNHSPGQCLTESLLTNQIGSPRVTPPLVLSGYEAAQLSECARLFQQPALRRNPQPLFQCRRQLHPAQAVQL